MHEKINAAPADAGIYILAEGPHWDAETRRLTWVDIEAGAILQASLVEGDSDDIATIGEPTRLELGAYVGFAVPAGGGRVLAGVTRELAIVEPDGTASRSAALLPEGQRFNDGKVDPQGRLVAGSLWLGDHDGAGNMLIRVEHDGSVTIIDDDLLLSNGLAWSPDGATFYSIDTGRHTVFRRNYGEGDVGEREAFLVLEDGAWPDGLAVDAEGNLWVAVWGGSGVRVYGEDGRRRPALEVHIEAPHCSSIAFAGAGLDLALMTSASRDLDASQRALLPHAGGLFLARSRTRGLPSTPWVPTPLPSFGLD